MSAQLIPILPEATASTSLKGDALREAFPCTDAPLSSLSIAPTQVPKPYGERAVVLPWSPLNAFVGEDGLQRFAWNLVEDLLRDPTPVRSSGALCDLLLALEKVVQQQGSTYDALRRTVDSMTEVEQRHFLETVLPWMKTVVLDAPLVFGDREVPLLVQGETRRLVLTHEEVLTLMCCSFFSLFPQRSEPAEKHFKYDRSPPSQDRTDRRVSLRLPKCNFASLFSCTEEGRGAAIENKIRCFLEYFFCCQRHHTWREASPALQRCVEVVRVCTAQFPDFTSSSCPLSAVFMCSARGGIREDTQALQVDFANRYVGGGVLRSGCVQEEISMTLAPEMVVSRIVAEALQENEVLFISGAPTFSGAVGYAETFRFQGGCDPWAVPPEGDAALTHTPVPPLVPAHALHPNTLQPLLMHDVCVLAMNACNFRCGGGRGKQFEPDFLLREIRKAYVGFHGVSDEFAALSKVRNGPIATGHWGCGAYCGDKELKLLLQWCAAAEAGGRPLHYHIFDKPLDTFDQLQRQLVEDGWTVGRLMRSLLRYSEYRAHAEASVALSPFKFIEQQIKRPL